MNFSKFTQLLEKYFLKGRQRITNQIFPYFENGGRIANRPKLDLSEHFCSDPNDGEFFICEITFISISGA